MILKFFRNRVGTRYSASLRYALFFLLSCTSGSQFDERNQDFFNDAKTAEKINYTTDAPTFSGGIQALVTTINAFGSNAETATSATIEGIVTMPSNYAVAVGATATGCATSDVIYSRSFILQDKDAAILVVYGLNPPSQNTADAASAKYILNAKNDGMAPLGSRLKITVSKAQKYGSGANVIPIVTDFDVTSREVVSSGNGIPYAVQSAAFARGVDLYQTRQLEGYVLQSPAYVECSSGRSFQFNYQQGYMGILCVGAANKTDAMNNCTGGTKFNFQMSLYLGAGTLSGFDVGDMYSYNIAEGAKVRMTGPVFAPEYNSADTNLSLMLGLRSQVETLK